MVYNYNYATVIDYPSYYIYMTITRINIASLHRYITFGLNMNMCYRTVCQGESEKKFKG